MSKLRNYCFTSFCTSLEFNKDVVVFLTYGCETCPTTGKAHLQGYVEFNKPMRLKAAQTAIGDPVAHLEKRLGSQEQAIKYCHKEDSSPFIFGEPSKQGKRTDLETALHDNKTIEEFKDNQPMLYCQYRNGVKELYADRMQKSIPDFRPVEVFVFYGDSGVGKSRRALEESGGDYYRLTTSSKNVWFDGYTGQKNLIIEEFYGQIKYNFFLEVLDGYKIQLPVKGGFVWSNYSKVFITSNKHPSLWYKQGLTPALERRLKNIVCMSVVCSDVVPVTVGSCSDPVPDGYGPVRLPGSRTVPVPGSLLLPVPNTPPQTFSIETPLFDD